MRAELINWENGIANRGNWARMKRVMRKALSGEELTIGFIGGSITQGAAATQPKLCYAYRVYEWWQETFPAAMFHYVNAGIGATDSQFAAARAEEDLLSYHPDFVLVDFSVNDESNEHFSETYEGLVRKIYKSETAPAMLLVHHVFYHNGANAQLIHARIGRHYELPCFSMQSTLYQEVVSGRIANREITPDDLHPNDAGHELAASGITFFLKKMLADIEQEEREPALPDPQTGNSYENSVRYRAGAACVTGCDGFLRDERQQCGITDCFKKGWISEQKGAWIRFRVNGTGVSVQYRKSMRKPAPTARVTVDGDVEHSTLLDANFDETWGDKPELATITEHMESGEHEVKIELVEAAECLAAPFYLMSILVTKQ